jgi:hypothetical protein
MDRLGLGNTCRPEDEEESSHKLQQSQDKSRSRHREDLDVDKIIIEVDDSQSSIVIENSFQNDFDNENS